MNEKLMILQRFFTVLRLQTKIYIITVTLELIINGYLTMV